MIDRDVAHIAKELAEVKAMLAQLLAASQPATLVETSTRPEPHISSRNDYITTLAAKIAAGDREALHEHNRRRAAARKKNPYTRRRR